MSPIGDIKYSSIAWWSLVGLLQTWVSRYSTQFNLFISDNFSMIPDDFRSTKCTQRLSHTPKNEAVDKTKQWIKTEIHTKFNQYSRIWSTDLHKWIRIHEFTTPSPLASLAKLRDGVFKVLAGLAECVRSAVSAPKKFFQSSQGECLMRTTPGFSESFFIFVCDRPCHQLW